MYELPRELLVSIDLIFLGIFTRGHSSCILETMWLLGKVVIGVHLWMWNNSNHFIMMYTVNITPQ
jgi:hypothetical protein